MTFLLEKKNPDLK